MFQRTQLPFILKKYHKRDNFATHQRLVNTHFPAQCPEPSSRFGIVFFICFAVQHLGVMGKSVDIRTSMWIVQLCRRTCSHRAVCVRLLLEMKQTSWYLFKCAFQKAGREFCLSLLDTITLTLPMTRKLSNSTNSC